MKDAHITVRLPAALVEAMDENAAHRDVPRSRLVREAVVAYLTGGPVSHSAVHRTAAEVAAAWRRGPRLNPEEAEAFAADVEAFRRAVPPPVSPWD